MLLPHLQILQWPTDLYLTWPLPTFLNYFVPPEGHTGFISAPQIRRACSCFKAFAFAVLSQKLFPSQFRTTGSLTFRSQLQCHLLRGFARPSNLE